MDSEKITKQTKRKKLLSWTESPPKNIQQLQFQSIYLALVPVKRTHEISIWIGFTLFIHENGGGEKKQEM